jgi:hypothetical protein
VTEEVTLRAFADSILVVPASIARNRNIDAGCGSILIVYPDHLGLASVHREVAIAMEAQRQIRASGGTTPEVHP